MKKETPQLILNVSGNLLGFCLIVITSLHIANFREGRFVDGLMLVVASLLTSASVLSFLAIKREGSSLASRLGLVSEYFFFSSLLGILITVLLITLDFVH